MAAPVLGAPLSPASSRLVNFSAGPAALPEPVLLQLREELWSLEGTGVGILEHSHRGPAFDRVLHEALADCRTVGAVPETHEVLFVPGGATLQFAMVPMNLLPAGGVADHLDTGVWAHKSIIESRHVAAAIGARIEVAFDGRPSRYDHVPADAEIRQSDGAAYLHYCSNNTVYGTQFADPPATDGPLVCDASSDIYSRPIDFARHDLVYASGQKNLGPSGMVVVMVRRDLLGRTGRELPSMLDYAAYAAAESRPNTPNTLGIRLVGLVCRWILDEGGLPEMERRARLRAGLLYAAIDRSAGFYAGLARPASRSLMNVSFRLAAPELEERFVTEAHRAGLDGLRGHREAGGIRASMYNAMPTAGAQALADFMDDFARRNG